MLRPNPAPALYSIHPILQNRWSQLAFLPQPVDKLLIECILEAGRWAPSSFNEQPWTYVVGYIGDPVHEQLASCIFDGNSWAKHAPVLIMSVASYYFQHNHKPNKHYMHDVGASNAYMHLQATALNLAFHQMAGFDNEKAESLFGIGDDHEAVTLIAIGYAGDSNMLPDDLKIRDFAPRTRKPFSEMFWDPTRQIS